MGIKTYKVKLPHTQMSNRLYTKNTRKPFQTINTTPVKYASKFHKIDTKEFEEVHKWLVNVEIDVDMARASDIPQPSNEQSLTSTIKKTPTFGNNEVSSTINIECTSAMDDVSTRP